MQAPEVTVREMLLHVGLGTAARSTLESGRPVAQRMTSRSRTGYARFLATGSTLDMSASIPITFRVANAGI